MSTSDLGLRIVDTLTDLFERGKLTYEQYQAQLAAAHDRSLAAESSLSPPRDHGVSKVKSTEMEGDRSEGKGKNSKSST